MVLFPVFISFYPGFTFGQSVVAEKSVFKVQHPDYGKSPFTGMTRQHWKDAALYVLQGAFSYVHSMDDPMQFPKQQGKSYPQNQGQVPTEKLEGLSRTLFVAAPLLKDNPNLVVNGIRVAEYYRHQILNLTDPKNPSYIRHRAPKGGPHQNLVEFGAIAISMTAIPEVLWEPYTKAQKDSIAALMLSYGDGPTVDSNWKFFNIFVLSFFKSHGYQVNDKLLVSYLEKSLKAYKGDGWYNDSPAYDYYSMWAFQMYGIYWAEYYGKQFYPDIAQKFIRNFSDLNNQYPYLFSRDGKMIMWGRSISYRYAAATVFPFMGFEPDMKANWGWLRRIASGTMLQFLTHPDFMDQGVPTLGFYGPFEPAVQVYSCRGSVYWGGKIFLGLLIPENSPFWTATENEGPWVNEMKKDSVYNHFASGSGTMVTNYPNIGASEVRAWCHEAVAKDWQKFRSTENYNRLSYNSAFLWQADGDNGEVAMNYVIKNRKGQWEALRLYDFKKFEDGVYFRDASLETNPGIRMHLADIPLSDGILRVDVLEAAADSVAAGLNEINIRLGHYALPQFSELVSEKVLKSGSGTAKSINNGYYELTMLPVEGFKQVDFIHCSGLHPERKKSVVMNATDQFRPTSKTLFKVYVSLLLWKKSAQPITKNEINLIDRVQVDTKKRVVLVKMRTSHTYKLSF